MPRPGPPSAADRWLTTKEAAEYAGTSEIHLAAACHAASALCNTFARRRMAMLKGIYFDEMPYRDPHTAGQALWALLQSTSTAFEVSFCPVVGESSWRKGLEAVAIARHRQCYGRFPTVNFGRMPLGYRMSSGNNARLVAAGKRQRGGLSAQPTDAHLPGHPPSDHQM